MAGRFTSLENLRPTKGFTQVGHSAMANRHWYFNEH